MSKRIFTAWNAVWAVLFLLGVLVLLMPQGAQASKADDPGSYGGWGSPTSRGVGGVSIAPFNEKQPEISSLACVVRGKALTEKQIDVMSELAKMTYLISEGKLTEEIWGGTKQDESETDDEDRIREPWYPKSGANFDDPWSAPNHGFPEGAAGARAFLRIEKKWLEKPVTQIGKDGGNPVHDNLTGDPTLSAWSDYRNREFQSEESAEDTGAGDKIWVYMDKNKARTQDNWKEAQEKGFPLTITEAKQIAAYINVNTTSGLSSFKTGKNGLPDGCITATFDNNLDVSFGQLFDDPGEFFVGLTVGSALDIVGGLYESMSQDAWSGLMHTAHTERGDMIWDIDDKCLSQENRDFVASRDPSGDRVVTTTAYGDTCQNNTPLGFSKKNTKIDPKDRPFYLDLAALIAWLITGTYFVILFASAVVFIYRGNRSQSMNLMRVAPKLLLSIMLAIAATFLIGAAISVSNWVTMAILDMTTQRGSPVTIMNIMLSTTGQTLDLPTLPSAVMTLFVATITLVASFVFLFGVVIKQLMLIVLIVLAPIAIFCLVVDSWRPQFMRWLKSFGILLMIPIGIALIMQLGVLLNPVMSGGVSQFLSVFMLIGTVVAMAWIMKTGLSIAITGKNVSFMDKIGQAAQLAAPYVPGGAALGVAGKGLSTLGNKANLGNKIAGSLIPEGRAATAGSEGPGLLSKAKNAVGDSRNARKDRRVEKADKRKGNDPNNEHEKGRVRKKLDRMRRKKHLKKADKHAKYKAAKSADPTDTSWIKGAGVLRNLRNQVGGRVSGAKEKVLATAVVADTLAGLSSIPFVGRRFAGIGKSAFRDEVAPLDRVTRPKTEYNEATGKEEQVYEKDDRGRFKRDDNGDRIPVMETVMQKGEIKGVTIHNKAEGNKMYSEISIMEQEMQQRLAEEQGYSSWGQLVEQNPDRADAATQQINQQIFDKFEVYGGSAGMTFNKKTQTWSMNTTEHAYKHGENRKNGSYSLGGMSERAKDALEEENLRRGRDRNGYDDRRDGYDNYDPDPDFT